MSFLACLLSSIFLLEISEKPKEVEFSDTLEVVGTVRGNEQVTISSSVTDTVSKIHVSEGTRVN